MEYPLRPMVAAVAVSRIDTSTGEREFGDLTNFELDDVLDDRGAVTLRMGAGVVVVPTERLPTGTGIAAI